METKPKIDFSKDGLELISDLKNRLSANSEFHFRNELVANSLLNMMLEKTLMYGGNDNSVPVNTRIVRAYYEGIGRKANRLPRIIERIIESGGKDLEAKKEFIDTLLDLGGYSIIGLAAVAQDIQDEQIS
jgi:hypothetical protein